MLLIASTVAIIVAIVALLYVITAKDDDKKGDGCPSQEQANTNIRQWMYKETNRDILRQMISQKIHAKASDLEDQIRQCLLTHHLPKFLDAHLLELIGDLQSIKACDTAHADKLQTEITQYVSSWVDKVYSLLLHRCRCNQIDGDLPLAILPYGDDDSLDASREMSTFAFVQKRDPVSACVRRQFLKEVYAK